MSQMEHEMLLYYAVHAGAALMITTKVIIIRERFLFYRSKRVIRDISRMYSAMQRVINNTHADRFLILGLHNGGKVMRIHSKKYITIFEEFHSPNVPSIKGDYSKYQVGAQYILMVNNLIEKHSVSGRVEEMEYSFLRDAYEKDGIKAYYLFYVGWLNGTHFFGSVSTTSDAGLMSPQQFQEIRVCTEKVKQIMRGRPLF